MFDIRDAEIIHQIARSGGFRAASQQFGLSQSAISTRTSALERRLGIELFDRRHRGARPTPEGRAFLDQTARLMAMRDEIVSSFTSSLEYMGTIRIGVVETVVHTWLAAMLRRLKATMEVRFELSVDTSMHMAQKLLDDQVDVAILMRDLAPDRALCTTIYSCELAYYASPSMGFSHSRLRLADLVRYPIVTFPKQTIPYAEFERLLLGTSLSAPLLHGCASLSTALHLIKDGFGIGLLPAPMAEGEVATGRLVRLETTGECTLADLNFSLCYLPAQPKLLMERIKEAVVAAID